MLRIAMLSFAHVHVGGYVEEIVKHPEAEVACLWDDDPKRLQAAAQRFGAPACDDLDAILERADIDGVVISSETAKHAQLIEAAIQHGKHVFTEKGLTIRLEKANEIVRAVNDSDIRFMIMLPMRTRADILFMKRTLDEGWIGKVSLMRAHIGHNWAIDRLFKDGHIWFGDCELAGGGAMFELGSHTVDIMRWFMGEPKSVVAKINNFSGAYPIDDNSAAVVEFKSGALGILDTAWVQRAGPNPVEIYGTDGFIGLDLWREPYGGLRLTSTKLQPNGIQGYIEPTELPDALPGPMDQWISAILHGTEMTITVEDGRNLTEMLEGIYTAARKGSQYVFQEGLASD